MSIHTMEIRHATSADTPALLPLLFQLGYPCELEVLRERLIIFLNHPGYGVAVCQMEETLVGCIAWSKSDLFVSNQVRFHIEALIVDENFRRKGIGKQLIAFLENIAKHHAPAIIDLTSSLKRAKEGTHEFYKSLGYRNEGALEKVYLRKEF